MDLIQDCTRAYLRRLACREKAVEGGALFTFSALGDHGAYPTLVYARAPFLICLARFSHTVPDARRLEVAEFLHRVNYGLLLGNFEMDYDEGEIRFRTSLMSEGPVPPDVLGRYIQSPAAMLDRCAPGLAAIIEEGEIAGAALRLTQSAS